MRLVVVHWLSRQHVSRRFVDDLSEHGAAGIVATHRQALCAFVKYCPNRLRRMIWTGRGLANGYYGLEHLPGFIDKFAPEIAQLRKMILKLFEDERAGPSAVPTMQKALH
jgi:hypothetical protein